MKDNASELQHSRIQSNASYMEGLEGGISLPAPTYGLTATPNPVQKKENNTGLNDHVKQKMESSFGQDFSDVNIHTNSNSATEMGALAYTQGSDIHFAPGEFDQSSTSGQELLGHELSHVVQQRQGRVQATHQEKGQNVNAENSLESEADTHGAIAARGGRISSGGDASNNNGTAQKQIQKKNAPIQKHPGDSVSIDENANVRTLRARTSHIIALVNQAASQLDGGYGRPDFQAKIGGDISSLIHNPSFGLHTFTFYHDDTFNSNFTVTINLDPAMTGTEVSRDNGQTQHQNTNGNTTGNSDETSSTATGGVEYSGASMEVESGRTNTRTRGASRGRSDTYSTNTSTVTANVNTTIGVTVSASVSSDGMDMINPWQWGGGLGSMITGNSRGTASGSCIAVVHQVDYSGSPETRE